MFRSIPLLLFLSLPLSAADDIWVPERVPASGTTPFVLYYQQFLRTNPFPIESPPKTPEAEMKNRLHHRQSADLYAAMSKVAANLVQSEDLLPAVPVGIKKEDTKKIQGSWNLYQNVPINVADFRCEFLYMRYRALSHETSLDAKKIAALHEFVAELEKDAKLQPLFQDLKRNACSRALSFVHRPLKAHADKPAMPLPEESELGKNFSVAVQWFIPFVQKYPNEKNLELADSFLETIEMFRACYPNSDQLPVIVEAFRNVFAEIQKRQVPPLIREYAEVYEGVLRRHELLGKPMPIWGADLSGKPIDEKTLDGKVVLLDFWATWCGPCTAEFPHLKLLYQKYKDKGFDIVSFSVDAEQEKLLAFLERNPLPWIVLSKESSERVGLPPLSRYYGAKALPVVLLRDRDGRTLLINARGHKLDEMLEQLFE